MTTSVIRSKAAVSRVLIGGVLALVVVAGVLGFLATQTQPETNSTNQTELLTLNGAGATFPFPLIAKMSDEYLKVKPNIQVNYQSIGSGGGIAQHVAKTVDFAASDAPLTDEQFANAAGTLTIPFTIGTVVPTYNVPEAKERLKFTGEILAEIFLAKIKKWNDPRLVELNPELQNVDKDIIVVHRSDGSGTTFVWVNYLSDVSVEWREKVGKSTSVNWPAGLGGKGNEGVAGLIGQNPHSIGYNELAYAKLNNIPYGAVRNAAGEYIIADLEASAKAAAAAALTLPKGDATWSKVSIIDEIYDNADAKGAYPVTSFSYFFIYKEFNVRPGMAAGTARAVLDWLWWAVHDGQSYAENLVYVPLPEEVVRLNEETLRMATFNGQPILR
ncbi:MAG: phosphate ABC transporter substrate-binding protein PstS [Thaumarchaeota archaeon]|nr:phosphate ABC transporter substrate-binding protein PstS [Nitrososphaerota archaeon]